LGREKYSRIDFFRRARPGQEGDGWKEVEWNSCLESPLDPGGQTFADAEGDGEDCRREEFRGRGGRVEGPSPLEEIRENILKLLGLFIKINIF